MYFAIVGIDRPEVADVRRPAHANICMHGLADPSWRLTARR
jgi:hypothetical protein